MSGAKGIVFDEIHTLEKQRFLAQMMTEVSNEIHAKFPPQNPVSGCPCCGSVNHMFYAEKFKFQMDVCKACQHIFTNPMPSDDALNYYYNSELKVFENKFFNDTRSTRVKIFIDRLTEIQRQAKGNQLLDIGSAVGIFLDANRLAGKPFDITSCDISAEACSYISAHYEEVRVVHSDVMLLSEDKRYDCITLWDTLEHIVDPISLLEKLGRLLNPDGILCFSTPNTLSFEWKIMGMDHVQLLPPGHVNLYNTHNIHVLLKAAGFNINSLRTPNASLDVSYIKKMLSQQECAQHIDSMGGAVGALTKILCEAFWSSDLVEDALIDFLKRRTMAGNMVVIASKAGTA